jgi:hypothetical protein
MIPPEQRGQTGDRSPHGLMKSVDTKAKCRHPHREGGERTREKVRGATVHKAGSRIPA